MPQRTVYRTLVEDLGVKAYKRRRRQHIPVKNLDKRLKRCKDLLRRHGTGPIVFTDEKKWTVEEKFNAQNDRIYAQTIEDAQASADYYVTRIQNPAGVMVWAGISEEGKFALKFMDDEKITGTVYREKVLKAVVKPRADLLFGTRHWTYQQDGAPAHTSNVAQTWLSNNVPAFVAKDEWPANSPDLNPCDFYLWGRLEDIVNTKRYSTVASLKAAIQSAWDALDDEEVAAACLSFKNRLSLCVGASGGVFVYD